MRRKILVLASWYPSDAAPVVGIFVQEQAQLLAERFETVVLVPHVFRLRSALRIRRGTRTERRAGLDVYHGFALRPPFGLRSQYASYLSAARHGLRAIGQTCGHPDLIHAHVVLPGGWIALRLGNELGVPVVLTEHSNPFAMHLSGESRPRLVRETLLGVDRVLAVSPALRDQIRAFEPRVPVEVVGNVIATQFFTPLAEADSGTHPVRFLSVALLTEAKGMHYLLQAAALLADRGVTGFEVTIAGEGPARAGLERLAADLKLADRCRFTGLLDQCGVRDEMRRCDVFVLPSLRETFGIVQGEAMACGKPVIATRCGGSEYVVDDATGVLVPAGNPHTLASAMEDFIAGRMRFDPMRVRERVIERFGERVFLERVAAVYEELWSAAAPGHRG